MIPDGIGLAFGTRPHPQKDSNPLNTLSISQFDLSV